MRAHGGGGSERIGRADRARDGRVLADNGGRIGRIPFGPGDARRRQHDRACADPVERRHEVAVAGRGRDRAMEREIGFDRLDGKRRGGQGRERAVDRGEIQVGARPRGEGGGLGSIATRNARSSSRSSSPVAVSHSSFVVAAGGARA